MDKVMEFKKLVAQYCEVVAEDIKDEMRFREDLGFTSLGFMSFMGDIEDTFDVELDQDQAVQIHTVGDALQMLNALMEA